MTFFTRTGKLLLVSAISLSLIGMPAFADPPQGKGKPDKAEKHAGKKNNKAKKNKKDRDNDVDAASLVMAGITASQARRLALDYRYTGYKSLPPGIAKNLARGKPLPPGIAKKMVPSRMLSRLPRHAGYEWRVAGSDLILVAMATNVVADVLAGVFR